MIIDFELFIEALNKRCNTDFVYHPEYSHYVSYSYDHNIKYVISLSSYHCLNVIFEELWDNNIILSYNSSYVVTPGVTEQIYYTLEIDNKQRFIDFYNDLIKDGFIIKKYLKPFSF